MFFVILLLITTGISDDIYAQKKQKKKKNVKHWGLNISVKSSHDNNILKYSEKYINRFNNGEEPERFKINSLDAFVIQNTVEFKYQYSIFGKLNTRFFAKANSKFYIDNPVKNFVVYGIGFRQYLSKSSFFNFTFSKIPNFYVRHYKDADLTALQDDQDDIFRPYEFTKDDYSIYLQNSITSSTKLRIEFSFMEYLYNEYFSEYDAYNILYGIKIYQTLSKRVKLNAGYRYVRSKADQLGSLPLEAGEKYVDPSFDEYIFSLGLSFSLPRMFGVSQKISLSGKYNRRYYTTNVYYKFDPLHTGRYDFVYRANINYGFKISRGFTTSFFYTWNMRYSSSTIEGNKDRIAREKDFEQNIFGINMEYSFKF